MVSGITRDYSRLQIFHIYFDTSTYDEVEKDVKVTMEGMLGVVGGTMGLLTGKSVKFFQTLSLSILTFSQVSQFSAELRFFTLELSYSSPCL